MPYSSTGKFRCDQPTTNTTPQHNEQKEKYKSQLPTKTYLSFPKQADKGTPGLPKQSCGDRLKPLKRGSEKRFSDPPEYL